MKGDERSARDLLRLRFTDEWVGLLVLLAVGLFVAAVIEAGVLRTWLRPTASLYLTLPQSGTDGLALGADVEVLGIHAGTIRRIKLNPNGAMYAVAEIEPDAKPFIRRDSTATIRLRYAVAGATFVDIARGHAAPMDWHYAVIDCKAAPNPADTLTDTLNEIRAKILPTLDHAEHLAASLDTVISGVQAGHGTVGTLLTDDALVRRATDAVASLHDAIARLRPIEAEANRTLAEAHGAAAHLNSAAANVDAASPGVADIVANTAATTRDLPALVTQAQITADQLAKLAQSLRSSWLLGGGGKPPTHRLPAESIRP